MNTNYPALDKKGQEPEYKKTPALKISSVGTENTKKNSSQMPFGSALLTGTPFSDLRNSGGIEHIIHAAMMPQGSDEDFFIKKAVLAMQNSILLAERLEFKKLAAPFLAGGIYCNNESTKPRLAEALIRGTLNQLEKCSHLKEVIFVDFDAEYLKDANDKIKGSFDCPTNSNQVRVEKGKPRPGPNLLHKSLHGANLIINSENAQMGWGGGISGEIKKDLGMMESVVDQERKDLMVEFNYLVEEDQEGGNKYQCANCGKEFDKTSNPPVDGKYCSNCKDKVDEDNEKSFEEWQEELKELGNDMGQSFDENKVKQWKKEGELGRVEEVKRLLKSVKDNSQFLDLIKTKQNSNNLKELVSNKTASQAITIIKRFEYDNLSPGDKENNNKKMRKYYDLGENDTLTDQQINEYCYKVAIGQIKENEQDQNTIKPENNILKYFGIGALILTPLGLLLAFFIRKRKR